MNNRSLDTVVDLRIDCLSVDGGTLVPTRLVEHGNVQVR